MEARKKVSISETLFLPPSAPLSPFLPSQTNNSPHALPYCRCHCHCHCHCRCQTLRRPPLRATATTHADRRWVSTSNRGSRKELRRRRRAGRGERRTSSKCSQLLTRVPVSPLYNPMCQQIAWTKAVQAQLQRLLQQAQRYTDKQTVNNQTC